MKRIMIFIEGTTFLTKPFLYLFTKYGYQPIGKAVSIINSLYDTGNEIYLCSYVRKRRYRFIKQIMDYYGIRYTKIVCRDQNQNYKDLVEQLKPDILIEDDCSSIGGEKEWCITNVDPQIKKNIRSIVVKEFTGIDSIEKKILQ